jgi:hypothetical protein
MKYLGLLSTDARGKVGGMVLSRSSAGTTARRHSPGVQPATAKQHAARSRFAAAQNAWTALDYTDQVAWINLAAVTTWTSTLGLGYQPSAQQLYVQCAIMLATAGLTYLPTAPLAVPTVPAPTSPSLTYSSGDLDLSYTIPSGYGTPYVSLYISPPYSAGRRFLNKGQGRWVDYLESPYDTVNVLPYWEPVYGQSPFGANVRIWLQSFDPSSGWPSAVASATASVPAA